MFGVSSSNCYFCCFSHFVILFVVMKLFKKLFKMSAKYSALTADFFFTDKNHVSFQTNQFLAYYYGSTDTKMFLYY